MSSPWPIRKLLDFDRWVNERLLNGWAMETISSRCGKAQLRAMNHRGERGDWVWLSLGYVVDLLFVWDAGYHCLRCIQNDVGRPAF